MTPISDLERFVATRDAVHQVVEHVVTKARVLDDGKIRLTADAGGFGTPPLTDGRRVRIVDDQIEVNGALSTLTSVADAARFVGVDPGLPPGFYEPATPCEPDRPLNVDLGSARTLREWFAFAEAVLEAFALEVESATSMILWPEHFDLGFASEDADESRRANYGASPGDASHPLPYLYVGPWHPVDANDYWNAAGFNGALLSYSDLLADGDPTERAMQFLRTGRALLVSSKSA